jgi:hypothetical protein
MPVMLLIPEVKKENEDTSTIDNGTPQEMPHTVSLWYNLYISCLKMEDDLFLQKICRQIHLPYHKFAELVKEACLENWFLQCSRLHQK